jgi:hypothetical protein
LWLKRQVIEKIKIENVLFLDVETVPVKYSYNELSTYEKQLWDAKVRFQLKEGQTGDDLYEKAGIYAEFAKIVCISTALVYKEKSKRKIRVKSFYSRDEKEILHGFCELVSTHYNGASH